MDDYELLKCPVCMDVFKDPCFVCPGHHTLCRSCYQSVTAISPSRCPQCRQEMTHPVENWHVQSLVKHFHKQSVDLCQAKCEEPDSHKGWVRECQHCNQQLCRAHIKQHTALFQKQCQQALLDADQVVKVADQIKWLVDGIVGECCRQLTELGKKIRATLDADAPLTARIRYGSHQLRDDLGAENLGAAKAVFDLLSKSLAEFPVPRQLKRELPPESELVKSFDELFTDTTSSDAQCILLEQVATLRVQLPDEDIQSMIGIVKYLSCLHQRRDLNVVLVALCQLGEMNLEKLRLCLGSVAIALGDKALDN